MSESIDVTAINNIQSKAVRIAKQFNHSMMTQEHILAALLSEKDVMAQLIQMEVNVNQLENDLDNYFNGSAITRVTHDINHEPLASDGYEKVIKRITLQITCTDTKIVNNIDILAALLSEQIKDSFAHYFLEKQNVKLIDIKSIAANFHAAQHNPSAGFSSDDDDGEGLQLKNDEGKNHHKVLERFCTNLNNLASEGRIDPVIGREEEINSIIETLSRRNKNNIIMTGQPGIGKTAIFEGFAKKIVDGDVPESIKNAVVFNLEINSLIAGAKFRGEMEANVEAVIKAIEYLAFDGSITPIVVIDEIHTMVGTGGGGQGGVDISNIMKPALARGTLRCIGGTTEDEYRKHFEKDKALIRRFRKYNVEEPSVENAKRILKGAQPLYEKFHGIEFEESAIDLAVELSARYMTNKFLPDKAFDVIDIAGAQMKLKSDDEKVVIDRKFIERVVNEITGIKIHITEDGSEDLSNLEYNIKSKVYGQDEAVTELVDSVIIGKAGLRDPSKPIGSYLLVGPTGVGKTHIANALANQLGGKLIRFDMSEYVEAHSISKLIGSPPGYVGYSDGAAGSGLLVNALEESPNCVLLFDEIEKAHPDIYNSFLQMMDNGMITSSNGKTVSCRNAIILMTSNAGAKELQKNTIGFSGNMNGKDDVEIERIFSPEFRNRLDKVIKFKQLDHDVLSKIVDACINDLNDLAKEKNVTIVLDDLSKNKLIELGYDPKMGARPLKRVIQERITKPISKDMMFGKLKNGGNVNVSYENDFTFAY